MPVLRCPRCGLTIYERGRRAAPDRCPRCLGVHGVPMPLMPHTRPRNARPLPQPGPGAEPRPSR